MAHPLIPLVRDLTAILDAQRVPYLVMGGIAVRVWSIPRATYDVDLTLSCGPDAIAQLIPGMEGAGFTVPEPFRSGHRDRLRGMEKVKIQRFEAGRPIDVDLFFVTTEYQRAAFARRRQAEADGVRLWYMAPEDLILHKLIAGRDRDLGDVSDLMLTARPLDMSHLRDWADRLGVREGLERKVKEQGDLE